MHPAKMKKVDISSLTEEEQKLFRLYGKLPTHKNVLTKMQKDRKYFDSGDYALSKAGVAPQNAVGTAIPNPENIPHASSPPAAHQGLAIGTNGSNGHLSHRESGAGSTSPVRESSLAHIVDTPPESTAEELPAAPVPEVLVQE
ncbi:Endosulfine-domain-containing protein [Vararia minispora EC-137]|uniref:Endosulfine-domain-containing protein n=1 Tax=Vararia minispora EC-137 TaxID=1314806 RepID=A0ACB8QRZ1_9AGAM|nr:Endosulfine-domain-containing protein [Vararia minispora EC-137]